MALFLTLTTLLFSTLVLRAETVIDSNITESTTWTQAGSPYILDRWDDCRIQGESTNLVTLTIEAVNTLLMHNGAFRLGDDVSFRAMGTAENPVIFQFQTFPQNWQPHLHFGSNVAVCAVGAPNQPIKFLTTDRWDPENAHWSGIDLEGGQCCRNPVSVCSH
ncbi:MAG: hypothetical protein JXR40_05115 [Pontiellaceae bacterium]|nr:hypothetical protein [Pontiellaceae bacterium]